MKVVIHDLTDKGSEEQLQLPQDVVVISNRGRIRNCAGCFGCWIKTPGQCVIADEYQKMGALLGQADELVIVSRCSFGSYSSFVKTVLDRSISYLLPYFEVRQGKMHHRMRYQNRLKLRVFFYGDEISEEEKSTARKLVEANAVNFSADTWKVKFVDREDEIGEVITW